MVDNQSQLNLFREIEAPEKVQLATSERKLSTISFTQGLSINQWKEILEKQKDLTQSQIAKKFGRSRERVSQVCKKLNFILPRGHRILNYRQKRR